MSRLLRAIPQDRQPFRKAWLALDPSAVLLAGRTANRGMHGGSPWWKLSQV